MSAESLAKAREAKAAKRAANANAAVIEREHPTVVVADGDAVRERRRQLLSELADLPSEPAVEAAKVAPGTILYPGTPREDKTSFTRNDLEAAHKMVDVISPVTIPVTVNGVQYQLVAGQPARIPEPHYIVLMEHLETDKRINSQFRPPTRDEIERALAEGMYISPVHKMGVGPLPPPATE